VSKRNPAWGIWLRNGLCALALVLAGAIVWKAAENRSLQDKINAGRQDLVKAQTFATIDNNVIQLIAKQAAEKNDTALKALLLRNGITFSLNGPAAAAPAANAGETAGAAK
jgi:hypothetical protein